MSRVSDSSTAETIVQRVQSLEHPSVDKKLTFTLMETVIVHLKRFNVSTNSAVFG